eukprot:TRINITY_DN80699_c0_g1_i1.p1 TRINITY_DN80699_c0_g1~~TRINITY_DN80699_c0_g1_i1.p1  ORF type:complete len:237 (-),score=53.17 TRINITY_DN80699_c0_g1_i1:80-790(-)
MEAAGGEDLLNFSTATLGDLPIFVAEADAEFQGDDSDTEEAAVMQPSEPGEDTFLADDACPYTAERGFDESFASIPSSLSSLGEDPWWCRGLSGGSGSEEMCWRSSGDSRLTSNRFRHKLRGMTQELASLPEVGSNAPSTQTSKLAFDSLEGSNSFGSFFDEAPHFLAERGIDSSFCSEVDPRWSAVWPQAAAFDESEGQSDEDVEPGVTSLLHLNLQGLQGPAHQPDQDITKAVT